MCGRYYIEETPEFRLLAEAVNRSPLTAKFRGKGTVLSKGEIRPSNIAPVIASDRSGRRAVFPMKWGFSEKKLMINARSETAAVRPVFREAWASHRCIVPASYYFEWEHPAAAGGRGKACDRYRLRPEGADMTWLCGLYRIEEGLPCFVILTREPGEAIRFIHDRMPLMLPDRYVNEWIRPDGRPEEIAAHALDRISAERA